MPRAAPSRAQHMGTKEEFVKVRKNDLERLTTEVMQIRDFLPRILNGEVLESFQKLKIVEKNLERKEQELEQLRMDREHFKARLESVQADSLREKKEKLALRQQLNEARQQLLQQAEYCTEMGAAACTILWGVSSSEEVVKAILGGDKALKFFNITGQTMESFVKSLDGDVKELDSDENQFVFALAGIVTNVAAVACGREFLVTSSRVLLDTILQLLGDLKPGQCTKLKVLMLMSLYNVSINLKGLKYISESPGFIPLLWWLLSGQWTSLPSLTSAMSLSLFHGTSRLLTYWVIPLVLVVCLPRWSESAKRQASLFGSPMIPGTGDTGGAQNTFPIRMQRCVSTCCDLSSPWFWSRKSSPRRRLSSGAPCPCSASGPCLRAATPTCRPRPGSSWRTSALWSTTCRAVRPGLPASPGPRAVFVS
ncbi:heat shock factor 2-binding protein isoform X2 [Vicugna pacos]|uniref:Heat shock factor 2-binding protein isoform X2 n=1 Tax=Vicugna pacos TaxID=30538 RepID=A0ABM5DYJ2_VICPA